MAVGNKKIVVVGATGGVGIEIVRQALDQGYSVTAFVRDSTRLGKFGDRVNIVTGDLLDVDRLSRAIENHDAVLSAFGPRVPISMDDATLLEQFSRSLTTAMIQTGVRRLIMVSVAFLFKDAFFPPAYLVGKLFFAGIVKDSSKMEGIVRTSGLDWTIVRPPQLTDVAFTGQYRVAVEHLPIFGLKISRANTADFMLKALEDSQSIGKVIGVSE